MPLSQLLPFRKKTIVYDEFENLDLMRRTVKAGAAKNISIHLNNLQNISFEEAIKNITVSFRQAGAIEHFKFIHNQVIDKNEAQLLASLIMFDKSIKRFHIEGSGFANDEAKQIVLRALKVNAKIVEFSAHGITLSDKIHTVNPTLKSSKADTLKQILDRNALITNGKREVIRTTVSFLWLTLPIMALLWGVTIFFSFPLIVTIAVLATSYFLFPTFSLGLTLRRRFSHSFRRKLAQTRFELSKRSILSLAPAFLAFITFTIGMLFIPIFPLIFIPSIMLTAALLFFSAHFIERNINQYDKALSDIATARLEMSKVVELNAPTNTDTADLSNPNQQSAQKPQMIALFITPKEYRDYKQIQHDHQLQNYNYINGVKAKPTTSMQFPDFGSKANFITHLQNLNSAHPSKAIKIKMPYAKAQQFFTFTEAAKRKVSEGQHNAQKMDVINDAIKAAEQNYQRWKLSK